MIKTKTVQTEREVVEAIVCDKCKTEFEHDSLEAQEFFCMSGFGGYLSKIGDETEWSIDLCQDCGIELFGEYIRT